MEDTTVLAKRIIKKIIPGVLWQNPVVNTGLRMLDPLDHAVRSARNLSHLPPYSIRARSNGLTKQFGGKNFAHYGQLLSGLLQRYAFLERSSMVLEIGCGCGRTAIALAGVLDYGAYTGMDVDRISLNACAQNPLLKGKGFHFDLPDVRNNEYNPGGSFKAENYVFPYGEGKYDIIFLVSVFTHMLTHDVSNYIKEISRMLKPKGVCMITTFLMDQGRENVGFSFPYTEDQHYYYNRHLPEAAVGYYLDFFVSEFTRHNMKLMYDPLWGSWRNNNRDGSLSGFSQDIIFIQKN
jgi:SAM-dependent methyltransferase